MDFTETLKGQVQKAQQIINEIEAIRRNLQENCERLKDDVDIACNQQITSICQRKDQLYRQAEFLAAEQERLLQADLARLHQYQGSVLSLLQLYSAGTLKDDGKDLTCLKDLELPRVSTTVPQLEFAKTGAAELEQAVCGFGRAHLQEPVRLKDGQTSSGSGAASKGSDGTESWLRCEGSDSNDSWLLCDMEIGNGEDEIVATSLPKSLSSATSSSIEAVSMDEEDVCGTLNRLTADPKSSRSPDSSPWLLSSTGGYDRNTRLDKLAKALSEIVTTDCKNTEEEAEEPNWLLAPKDTVAAKNDVVASKTSDINSKWLFVSKAKPLATSYATKIKDMFKPYFDHGNNSMWVARGKNGQ
ncbi:uncharacterized protein LOC144146105 [Haemaphysalis longicornis]